MWHTVVQNGTPPDDDNNCIYETVYCCLQNNILHQAAFLITSKT